MREKVIDRARELGLDVEVRHLDSSTRTVQEAAVAVGCDEGQIGDIEGVDDSTERAPGVAQRRAGPGAEHEPLGGSEVRHECRPDGVDVVAQSGTVERGRRGVPRPLDDIDDARQCRGRRGVELAGIGGQHPRRRPR